MLSWIAHGDFSVSYFHLVAFLALLKESPFAAVADALSTSCLPLLVQNWKGALESLTKKALGDDAPEVGKALLIDVKAHRPYGVELGRALRYLICVAAPNVNLQKSQPIADREEALKLLGHAYESAFETFFRSAFIKSK